MAKAQTKELAPEATAEGEAPAKAEKIKFVKMAKENGKEADVHPDEVFNYAKGGYVEVKGK